MQQPDNERPLRVCYFGTYRANYTRNRLIIQGLRAQGVTVNECHTLLWRGIEDRVAQASGGWRSPRFWLRALSAYVRLLRRYRRQPPYDVMLIGYPGQFDAYLGRLLTWLRRRPLALDVLMSLHLVAEERGLVQRSPLTGRLLFWLEKGGLKLPDLLIAENGEYEAYLRQKYDLPPERFARVPHGAEDDVFHPRPFAGQQTDAGARPAAGPMVDNDTFRVVYYGTYVPSHGLETIVKAAHLLRDNPRIAFHFFGQGPQRPAMEKLAREWDLPNVTFHGWVEMDELLDAIAQAHVCLGVFGVTRQSHFTIQNKVWQGLAMGRPVISGDSRTVRAALTHGEQIYLVERNSPEALAAAICELQADPALREHIAAAGRAYYLQHNTPAALGATMKRALQSLLP